jgi:hypothetical protein
MTIGERVAPSKVSTTFVRLQENRLMTEGNLAAVDAGAPRTLDLRRKIGWLCHAVRYAALGYALWLLYALVAYWTNVEKIGKGYGRLLDRDLSGMAGWQPALALGVHLVIWSVAAFACFSAWRLFTGFLAGRIFTADAARQLRRVALFGAVSVLLDIATRPLISVILTLHFPAGQQMRVVSLFFRPEDLVLLLLLFALLALAHVQKTAAEIAGEHAQFV